MDIQLTQILFQIINFSVVVGAVSFLLYKPVLKIFDERSKRIAEGERAAVKAQKAYSEIEKRQKIVESELKKERNKVIKDAQTEAGERRDTIISDAKAQAKVEIAELKTQWENEKAMLFKKAEKDMAESILSISEKVIGDALDKKAASQLIDSELKKIIKAL
ncbi:MAG: ATP synthase F0 subunit B [Candidatus Pacebacteria bacterium]|nr:ATP synthase F0 subunit B [Candidatus Paceibacterota bacterium]PIR63127.1 MAG: hypothetical protein COU64_06370 [Candidatus Pacebacteria bacterium CG10_big_fil_rev_8_21_14_0_10_40_26]PIZ78513.1 MAG: hypothetical protein COY01_04695 [Candidatus Pacebacteria bacterium CG_4_10_14_0_2_um_filter_40_20]PJA69364.1 MAG: hypothetical protein CO156_00585 [Candidatus Pacebacteria bacterium CG_4_9_14_3_um_filter_40_12]PJC41381.1 MAG: hypothetical protein CO041_04570 [Candidatus Pacebacteria bacterium CG